MFKTSKSIFISEFYPKIEVKNFGWGNKCVGDKWALIIPNFVKKLAYGGFNPSSQFYQQSKSWIKTLNLD